MNKVFFTTLYLSSLAFTFQKASSQSIVFNRTYSCPEYNYGRSAVETPDGGFLAVGASSNPSAGNTDVYLLHTDSAGNVLWEKRYGGTGIDFGTSLEMTSDSGFIVAGYTSSYGAGTYDLYLLRLNQSGDTLWTKTFGGTDWDFAWSVQQTADKGFVVVGETNSSGAGNIDVFLVKTDSTGQTQWTKTYGGTDEDAGHFVRECITGGYIITGYTKSFGNGNDDVYLIRTNDNGDTLWTKTFGTDSSDQGYCVQSLADSTFIIAGYAGHGVNGSEDGYIIKTDSLGNSLWTRLYDIDSLNDRLNYVIPTYDNGYMFTGKMQSNLYGLGGSDLYILKTDLGGFYAGSKVFGYKNNDEGFSVRATKDHGYIVCGIFSSILSDLYLIKTDSTMISSTLVMAVRENDRIKFPSITIYPNPISNMTSLKVHIPGLAEGNHIMASLVDLEGKIIWQSEEVFGYNQTCSLQPLENKPAPGFYFLNFYSGGKFLGSAKVSVM